MRKILIGLLSMLLVLNVIGCSPKAKTGGDEAKEGQADKPGKQVAKLIEPEELITKEEVEAFTGMKVTKEKKENDPGGGAKYIVYDLEKGDSTSKTGIVQIELLQDAFVNNPANKITAKDLYHGVNKAYEKVEPIQNLGDEAVKYEMFGQGVAFLKGEYAFRVLVTFIDEGDKVALQIATKAFENLEKILAAK